MEDLRPGTTPHNRPENARKPSELSSSNHAPVPVRTYPTNRKPLG